MTYVTNHGLMYKGVSQGSVLGRLLCNIIYNDMLRLSAAADSCLRRRHHHHISQVEAMANDVVACVKTWLDTASLDFVKQKTVAMLISIWVRVGNHIFASFAALKYIRVMFDNWFSSRQHMLRGEIPKIRYPQWLHTFCST
uniref:Reverse transcriptase n=1 Tax=Glossina morsitans morsitans TaxID=37546 RepID=D3TS15_GLOMM